MVKAIEKNNNLRSDKPKSTQRDDKRKQFPTPKRQTSSKDQVKNQDPSKVKKIQKSSKPSSELQSHYQRIVINVKKSKLNKEILNKSISEFLEYLKKNTATLTGKVVGAKVLQLCLKYGTNSHRETILLVLLKTDFVALCGSTYGGFIVAKIFRYCDKVDSIKVVKEFFRNNFRDLLKKKENLIALNGFINSMDEKTALNYLEKEVEATKFDEFYGSELIEYTESKPSLTKLSLWYYLIYHFFNTINEDLKVSLVQTVLKHVDEAINKSEQKIFVVLCILQIFLNVNFKNKKEIIKKFLKEKYLEYYIKHSGFIYLLIGLLKKISDSKVINITILKALKGQFEMFFNNVDIAKLIELLFSDAVANRLQKDKFYKCNPAIKRLLEIEVIDNDTVFKSNIEHIRGELSNESDLLNYFTFDQIKNRITENSTFSLLYSSLIEHMLKSKIIRSKYV